MASPDDVLTPPCERCFLTDRTPHKTITECLHALDREVSRLLTQVQLANELRARLLDTSEDQTSTRSKV